LVASAPAAAFAVGVLPDVPELELPDRFVSVWLMEIS
jgi:hypothetical protein